MSERSVDQKRESDLQARVQSSQQEIVEIRQKWIEGTLEVSDIEKSIFDSENNYLELILMLLLLDRAHRDFCQRVCPR
jgi:hypothetical protein